MERADKGLAFMLQYDNVAWYEKGMVKILDRRIYPKQIVYVTCKRHEEVAMAIKDMVTQSGGPYIAAGMGMALAAYEAKDMNEKKKMDFLKKAGHTIANARPTTKKRMAMVVDDCIRVAESAIAKGDDRDEAIFLHTIEVTNNKYIRMATVAKNLVDLFPKKGTIMTQCFAETIVGMMLKEAKHRNYDLKIITPETRPYYQGARLTASVVYDQGFDVTVITDNMPAYVMQKKKVDVFTSAADAICLDGHVVNKIGTFQITLAAHYHGIPYFVTGAPDFGHETTDTVKIEEREGDLVLESMGTRIAKEGVKGYYPAFDITPPHLVSGVVTDKGIFSPYDLYSYVEDGDSFLI